MTARVTATFDRPTGNPWRHAAGLLGERWLSVMLERPPGTPMYFTARTADGRAVGTLGYWIEDPDAYAAFNWYDLVWNSDKVFLGFPTAGPGPARASAFPTLSLVQPGYDCNADGDQDLLPKLVEGIVEWSRERGAATVSALYAHGPLASALVDRGFRGYRSAERALLTDPSGWPDNLTRNGRKQVAADLRLLAAAGVRVGPEPVEELAPQILPLRRALVARHGGYVTPDADRRTLDRLLAAFGPTNLRAFAARSADGTLVGFSLFTVDELAGWSSFWVGTGASADRAHFACLFYAPVLAARSASVSTLDFGLGLDPAKSRRGCVGFPRTVYVLPIAENDLLTPSNHPLSVQPCDSCEHASSEPN